MFESLYRLKNNERRKIQFFRRVEKLKNQVASSCSRFGEIAGKIANRLIDLYSDSTACKTNIIPVSFFQHNEKFLPGGMRRTFPWGENVPSG